MIDCTRIDQVGGRVNWVARRSFKQSARLAAAAARRVEWTPSTRKRHGAGDKLGLPAPAANNFKATRPQQPPVEWAIQEANRLETKVAAAAAMFAY